MYVLVLGGIRSTDVAGLMPPQNSFQLSGFDTLRLAFNLREQRSYILLTKDGAIVSFSRKTEKSLKAALLKRLGFDDTALQSAAIKGLNLWRSEQS